MNTLQILIVEDEVLIAELFSNYLKSFGHVVTGIALSYDEAIIKYNLHKPDLVLLDIRLYGEKSGIDFAQFLLNDPEPVPFIYLTSQYDQRTLKLAIETNPYGYLTKPIRKETLWTSIEAAYRLYRSKNKPNYQIDVFDGKVIHSLDIDEILYIKADHVYAQVVLLDGKSIHTRKSIKQLLNDLKGNIMIQVHRSYLVNRYQIKLRSQNQITLSNNQSIPVSRTKRNVFDENQ